MSQDHPSVAGPSRAPLSLEQYAAAMAHLAHFADQGPEPVLQRLGLLLSSWKDAKQHWTRTLMAEFDDEATPLARAFGAAYAGAAARLRADRPTLADVAPLLEPPKVGKAFQSVDETAFGVAAIFEPALPFAPGSGALPPPSAADEAPAVGGGMTQEVHALVISDEPLPFSKTRAPSLSLTQYASLHAELAQAPQHEEATLARYGIMGAEQRVTLEAAWAAQFAADPAQQRAFDELVATYVHWLRHRPPGHHG